MKKFIWVGVVACIFNLLAALLISTYGFNKHGDCIKHRFVLLNLLFKN